MARGGRRQGQPGKSYANRKDLNVVRADQPGSSATPPPQPEQPRQRILPDAIPNLNSPTAQPDIPIEVGVRAADPMMVGTPGSYDSSLLLAAFADLSIIELREYEAEIHEGQGHSGRSALVGLVAHR